MRRTMLTTHIDGFRRRKHWAAMRHLVAADDVSAPLTGPELVVTSRLAVHEALASLAPRERACVVLRYFDDLAIAEIATTLSLTEGAVKRYLSDGTRALEARLGPLSDSSPSTESVPVEPRRTR